MLDLCPCESQKFSIIVFVIFYYTKIAWDIASIFLYTKIFFNTLICKLCSCSISYVLFQSIFEVSRLYSSFGRLLCLLNPISCIICRAKCVESYYHSNKELCSTIRNFNTEWRNQIQYLSVSLRNMSGYQIILFNVLRLLQFNVGCIFSFT